MSRKDLQKGPERGAERPAGAARSAGRERTRRILLFVLFVFCLVIFSVTSEMTLAWYRLTRGGAQPVARLQLPGGPAEIDSEDYLLARSMLGRDPLSGASDPTGEDVIRYAVLRKLAEEYRVVVTDADLVGYIEFLRQVTRQPYQNLYRRAGYNRAADFENMLREVLRAGRMGELLANAAVVSTDEVLREWSEEHAEFVLEFAVWSAEEFRGAADQESPTEEQLQEFYASGLRPEERYGLEREEAITFEALVVTSDALATEAVRGWAGELEPKEEELQEFYTRMRGELYLRPQPPAGEARPEGWQPYLTREELGERLARDWRLYRAAAALLAPAQQAQDLAAFAQEKGVEHLVQSEWVGQSALASLPRVGLPGLANLAHQEVGRWWVRPFVAGDLAFIARPSGRRARELPPLEEIRDSVVDSWRARRADEMAGEAAEAFVAGLPRPEGVAPGDPRIVDAGVFAEHVGASGRDLQRMDWASRQPRDPEQPPWSREDRIRPWLRGEIGLALDVYADGQVVGPLRASSEPSHVVARIVGRRPADVAHIWPGELEQARQRAYQRAAQRFRDEQLSYEGLSRAFLIEKVLPEAP